MTVKLVKNQKTLLIKTVRVAGLGGGPVDRVGWIRIVSVNVPGGSTGNEVYEDPPNNTILQSVDVSDTTFNVVIESSFPTVEVNGVPSTIPLVGSIYRGSVSVTIAADGPVTAECFNPDGGEAATDTIQVAIDLPPTITALSFTGGYPGAQTELKAGDTFQLTGTTDIPADAVEVEATGASTTVQLLPFAAGTAFVVTMVIGDQGTSPQALPATVRARSASTGAFGPSRATNQGGGSVDGTDLVTLNNLFPTVSFGAVTYPGGQGALKGAEFATVVNTVSDFDSVVYDSPTSELSITNPNTVEDPKTVSRISGGYNVSIDNLRATANRAANDATTVGQTVVNIAAVAATITVQEPAARLRSGGNDGTAPQDHSITITSDQDLLAAPTLDPDLGGARGVFLGAFTGGPQVWNAFLRVLDTDEKGTFNWGSLVATNLAGIVTGSITGDSQYVLGGFVARSLTFGSFATSTAIGVEVVDFAKLEAGIFTATNQTALKQPIGTPPSVTNGYTIDATGINPTSVIWLDSPAAASNSGGTAQITNVEEVV